MTTPDPASAAPLLTDEQCWQVWNHLAEEGTVLPFAARIAEFTDEQVQAGELRRADREASAENLRVMRAALEPLVAALVAEKERLAEDRVRNRSNAFHDPVGQAITVCEAAAGGYCAGYLVKGVWLGCLHTPHETRSRAVVCAEQRLRYERGAS